MFNGDKVMNLDETKALAKDIIETGYAENMSEDDIKLEMFTQKIPYSKLNSIFKSLSIELGLMVNPKDVTDGANALIEKIDWTVCEEWDNVATNIDHIVDNVDGASAARVLTLIRAFCKDEEIELPRKPKASSGGGGGSKGGKVAVAVADLFAQGQPTKQEYYDTVLPLVKGPKNALAFMSTFFLICSAAKAGSSLAQAIEDTKDMPMPDVEDTASEDEDEDMMA